MYPLPDYSIDSTSNRSSTVREPTTRSGQGFIIAVQVAGVT